jgi:hypothetical protein
MNVVEICALLGYYAASYGDCLPTFRDNMSVPCSRIRKSKKKTKLARRHAVYTGEGVSGG